MKYDSKISLKCKTLKPDFLDTKKLSSEVFVIFDNFYDANHGYFDNGQGRI